MLRPTRPDRSRAGGDAPPGAPSPLDEAMLRAYTIERAIDYGCSVDDASTLRRRAAERGGWVRTAIGLAEDDLERAAADAVAGRTHDASAWSLRAAACLRLAQSALEDDVPARIDAYRRQRDAFASGMREAARPADGFDVVFHGAPHRAWWFVPGRDDAPPSAVIVWGGADGWCEAFHPSVDAYLRRGLAVCLLGLPGQGWSRLAHGSRLGDDVGAMVAAAFDALVARGARPGAYGVVGHSMGGTLALAAAIADPRIVACGTNGGSVALAEGLAGNARVAARVGAMVGGDAADALRTIAALGLEARIREARADVLVLQGGRDPLVPDAHAQRLLDACRPGQATLEYWPEGVHCLYDRATERNAVLADWFARTLAAGAD